MSDYDPRRPSGSGPEPMDPSGGAPYRGAPGTASNPADAVPSYYAESYPGQPSVPQPYLGFPLEQYPGPYPGYLPGQDPGQYPGSEPGQDSGQYLGSEPDQYLGQQSGRLVGSPPGEQYGGANPTPGYAAYPQPAWAGSFTPTGWGGPPVPGQVTGAAVLGYVEAGFLIISSLFVFAGASIVNDTASALSAGDGGLTAQFVLAGMANLIAAALFIAGGTMFTSANPTGRVLLVAAITLTAVTALFWVIRFHQGAIVVWAIAFLTLPAIAACLAFGRSVNAWLQLPRPR